MVNSGYTLWEIKHGKLEHPQQNGGLQLGKSRRNGWFSQCHKTCLIIVIIYKSKLVVPMIPQMLSLSLVLPCSTTSCDFYLFLEANWLQGLWKSVYTILHIELCQNHSNSVVARQVLCFHRHIIATSTVGAEARHAARAGPIWPFFLSQFLLHSLRGGHVSKEVIRSALHSLGWNLLRADRSRFRTSCAHEKNISEKRIPSGKLSHNYRKSPFSIGKSTINSHFQ